MDLVLVEKEIRRLLETPNFMTYYGFRLHSLGDGECTVELDFQPVFERPGGVVTGPTFMAAADCTMWFALMTKLEKDEADLSVTIEMKTNFLSGGRYGPFLCTAKILKLGRRLVYGTAECTDNRGKLLTHHTLTYIRPEGRE